MTIARVVGTATLSVQPDEVHFRVAFSVRARKNSEKTLNQFKEIDTTAMKLLTREGFNCVTIPPHSWNSYDAITNETEYVISGGYKVRATNLSELASVMTDLLLCPDITIQGLVYAASNHDELKRQARIDAIQDARHLAADYAEALNMTVQEIVSITEPSYGSVVHSQTVATRAGAVGGAFNSRANIELTEPAPIRITGNVNMEVRLSQPDA